jgi:hypothetical protein
VLCDLLADGKLRCQRFSPRRAELRSADTCQRHVAKRLQDLCCELSVWRSEQLNRKHLSGSVREMMGHSKVELVVVMSNIIQFLRESSDATIVEDQSVN